MPQEYGFKIGLPDLASAHGGVIDNLICFFHWMMLVLFVGWGIYFVYCLVRFRQKAGRVPEKTPHFKLPKYIEAVVALTEMGLLIFLSYPLWAKLKTEPPAVGEALEVRVVAEQFLWNIHYPGRDGIFGRTDIELVDPVDNPVGLDLDDPNAKDDIVTTNELHVVVNKPVKIYLSSKDVIHSFALQQMRIKQDAIPGVVVPVWFTPTKTGHFQIACAQLCGIGHTQMAGEFYVDTEEDFEKFMKEQESYLEGE